MSKIKFDIQMFSGGGNWTAGVTQSAIHSAYDKFSSAIDEANEAIMNYKAIDSALTSGWSGQDCTDFLDKFHTHATHVTEQIDEYRSAVSKEVDSIISQWSEFQSTLIG